tara:strand:+ start:95 stop:313 length:219 start_codon:yes stop_codon:yes gene_type:complete
MASNKEGIVYSGSYACEGHTVHFTINENTVDIIEVVESAPRRNSFSTTKKVDIDEGIKIQENYIKLGYDKIS